MITIKQLEAFPSNVRPFLTEYAQQEFELYEKRPALFWGRNIRTWLFTVNEQPLFIAGLTKTSLIGSRAELWLMYCRDVGKYAKRVFRFLKRAIRRLAKIYPNIQMSVEHSFETGKSFARALGFAELPPDKYFPNNMFATFEYRKTN
jgi:hypothetical protein